MNKKMIRKNAKRLLAIVCAAAMLSNVCSIRVDAHYSTDVRYMQIPSLTFELLDDDKISLVKYRKEVNQDPYVLGIPSGVNVEGKENTQKLVSIADNVFIEECFSMIYVETNNGLSIGKSAFNKVSVNYSNEYVTDMDVNFKGGKNNGPITEIGESAFAYFYVPGGYVHMDNVTGKIGAHAFEQASILKSFVIEDGLIDEIGEYAFRSFHSSKFQIPDYIKLDEGAFSRANFKAFKLSDKVEYIGSKIFEGCDDLKEITLPAENHIKEVASDAFPDRAGLCINVPAGYEDLSSYHFDQYRNLSYCLSPEYTTDSEVYKRLAATGADIVFKQLTPATTTTMESIEPTNPATQSPEVTTEPAATQNPVIETQIPAATQTPAATSNAGKKKVESGKAASVGTTLTRQGIRYRITGKNTASCIGAVKSKKKLTIADSIACKGNSYRVTALNARAFYKDKTLENVSLGKNIETIKTSALEQCTQLKKVTFGKNMTTIEKRAFYKDKNLVRLIFEGGKLRKVGKQAFSKGKKTKKVEVPSYVNQKKYYELLQGSVTD